MRADAREADVFHSPVAGGGGGGGGVTMTARCERCWCFTIAFRSDCPCRVPGKCGGMPGTATLASDISQRRWTNVIRGVVLKKKWGTPETTLGKDYLNNLGLHTRTLIHVRKIATADLWSCPAIQLLVFECL